MSTRYSCLLWATMLLLGSCQSTKTALQRPATPAADGTTAVLRHDSQGPEPTRVVLSAEVAPGAAPLDK